MEIRTGRHVRAARGADITASRTSAVGVDMLRAGDFSVDATSATTPASLLHIRT
jgi:hypothetical protein